MPNYLATAGTQSPYVTLRDPNNNYAAVTTGWTFSTYGYGCDISPDGKYLAVSGTFTGKLRVFDLSTFAEVTLTSPPTSYNVYCCRFSADSQYLLYIAYTATAVQVLRIYNTSDWSLYKSDYSGLAGITSYGCAWYPSNLFICVVSQSGSPYMRVINTSTWGYVLNVTATAHYDCDFSADGVWLAVGCGSPYLNVYKYTTSWATQTVSVKPTANVVGVRFSPDSQYLACGSLSSPYFWLYETTTWTQVTVPSVSTTCRGLAWLPDSSKLYITGPVSQALKILDIATMTWDDTSGYSNVDGWKLGWGGPETRDCELNSHAVFSPNINIKMDSDVFQGLAVVQEGVQYSNFSGNGTSILMYRKGPDDKYYYMREILPPYYVDTGSTWHWAYFAPGGRQLWGLPNRDPNLVKSIRADGFYDDPLTEQDPEQLLHKPNPLSWYSIWDLSVSNDGKWMFCQIGDETGTNKINAFYFDGSTWTDFGSTTTDIIELRGYAMCQVSPNGEYLVVCGDATYNSSPFVWVYQNEKDPPDFTFTEMTTEASSGSFNTAYGMRIAWHPDSTMFFLNGYVFEWNSSTSTWEIAASGIDDNPIILAQFSPDGEYLVTVLEWTRFQVYEVATWTRKQYVTIGVNTIESVCWDDTSRNVFVGLDGSTGDCLRQYAWNPTSSTLTQVTSSDFSLPLAAVTSVVHTSPLISVDLETPLQMILKQEAFSPNANFNLEMGITKEVGYFTTGNFFNVFRSTFFDEPSKAKAYFAPNLTFTLSIPIGPFTMANERFNLNLPFIEREVGYFYHQYAFLCSRAIYEEIIVLINNERVTAGVGIVRLDYRIQAACIRHVEDMAANRFLSHDGSDGSTFEERLEDANYIMYLCVELLSQGVVANTAQQYVDAWMANEEAAANIVLADYDDVGCYSLTNEYGEVYVCLALCKWHPQYTAVEVNPFTFTESFTSYSPILSMSDDAYNNFIAGYNLSNVIRYKVVLGEYEIKGITSIAYKMKETLANIDVTAIFSDNDMDSITDNASEALRVYQIINGLDLPLLVIESDFDEFSLDESDPQTITLSAHRETRHYTSTADLLRVKSNSRKNGKRIVTSSFPNFFVKPGFILNYGEEQIEIEEIDIRITDTSTVMDITVAE